MSKTQLNITTRYLNLKDIPRVLDIDYQYSEPWDKDYLLKNKRDKDIICVVAENSELIIGFAIYDTSKGLNLLKFRVDEAYTRLGVGGQLMDYIKKMAVKRGKVIHVDVNERNLGGQLFLKSQGFTWIKTKKVKFEDDGLYLMVYSE
jgi:ribosomal protein S18 acetylase RimI-like enzyme